MRTIHTLAVVMGFGFILLFLGVINCSGTSTSPSSTKESEPLPTNYIQETQESSDFDRALIVVNDFLGYWTQGNWAEFYSLFRFPMYANGSEMSDRELLHDFFKQNLQVDYLNTDSSDSVPLFMDRVLDYEGYQNQAEWMDTNRKSWVEEVMDPFHFLGILDIGAALEISKIFLILEKKDTTFQIIQLHTF